MTETKIDLWASNLDDAIGERALTDEALKELEETDESSEQADKERAIEEVERMISEKASGASLTDAERFIEQRLEEF